MSKWSKETFSRPPRCARPPPCGSAGHFIEQIVLTLLELDDLCQYLAPAFAHGVGMPSRFTMRPVGQRRLRHQGLQPSIVGVAGQLEMLFVEYSQLVA